MFKWLRYPVVFLLGTAWSAMFQIWGAFPDPDAFYHAKIASLMAVRGPFLSFPWLDLTTLHPGFNDQHLLFHYFLIPFVRIWGTLPGEQVAAVVAGGLFALVALFLFERLGIQRAWFWTLLLMALPPMILRLSLGKASPFAIGLFLLGILVWRSGNRVGAFIIGFVYALTHGGWPMLIGAQIVLAFGDWIYARFVKSDRQRPDFRIALYTLGGGLLGTFVHPNFPDNLPYLWIQIFQIGVATPIGRVMMGSEWYPYQPLELAQHLALLAIVVCLGLVGWVYARRKEIDELQARFSIGLGSLAAIFFALTFKSARFVEYLVPVLVLWIATAFAQIDTQELMRILQKRFRYLPHVIVVMMMFVFGKGAIATRSQLATHAKPFTRFSAAMDVVSRELKPGDRLFHSDWAQFPLLWNLNDRLRYVAGLDPTFLLQASSTVSDAYTDLTLGRTTSSAFETISGTFDAHMVLVERKPGQKFEEILRADHRFQPVYTDEEAAVFKLIH